MPKRQNFQNQSPHTSCVTFYLRGSKNKASTMLSFSHTQVMKAANPLRFIQNYPSLMLNQRTNTLSISSQFKCEFYSCGPKSLDASLRAQNRFGCSRAFFLPLLFGITFRGYIFHILFFGIFREKVFHTIWT